MTCQDCKPEGILTGPRDLNRIHVGSRFLDRFPSMRVIKGGQDITNQTIEAIESDDKPGMVLYYPVTDEGRYFYCDCGDALKIVLYFGSDIDIYNVPTMPETWEKDYEGRE